MVTSIILVISIISVESYKLYASYSMHLNVVHLCILNTILFNLIDNGVIIYVIYSHPLDSGLPPSISSTGSHFGPSGVKVKVRVSGVKAMVKTGVDWD